MIQKQGKGVEELPCSVSILSGCLIFFKKLDKKNLTSIVEITIHDGVNHEVKRMMESIGHNVIKLKREAFGFLSLYGLKSGEKRILTTKEVKQLYNMAINK